MCSSVISTNHLNIMTLQGTHKNLIDANSNINLSFKNTESEPTCVTVCGLKKFSFLFIKFKCGDMETYTKDNIPVLNKWIHSMHRWKPDSAFQSHCILRVWLCGYKIIWYIYNIIKMSVLLIENNLKFKFRNYS